MNGWYQPLTYRMALYQNEQQVRIAFKVFIIGLNQGCIHHLRI